MNDTEPISKEKDLTGLLNKVKNYLLDTYEPCQDPAEAFIHHTTDEIYRNLQRLLPNEHLYTSADVAKWLHDAGFTFYDYGDMRFEWMMKKAVILKLT
jgi:hypothetical protein